MNANKSAISSGTVQAENAGKKRRQCQVAQCNNNKTTNTCTSCEKAVCGAHTGLVEKKYICVNCI